MKFYRSFNIVIFRKLLNLNCSSTILVFCGASLFVYLGVGTNAYLSYLHELDSANQYSESFAQSYDEHITGLIGQIDLMLKQVTHQILVHRQAYEKDPNEMTLTVRNLGREFTEVETVGVVDKDGNNFANSKFSTMGPNPKIDVSDRKYFKYHQSTPNEILYITNPQHSRLTGKAVINFSRRVTDENGLFLGVVFASIRLEDLNKYFETANLGKNGSIKLINSSRILLARYPELPDKIDQIVVPPGSHQDQTLNSAKSGSFIEASSLDQVERVYTFRNFEKYKFTVIVGLAKAEVLRVWNRNLALNFSMATLLLIFAGTALIRFRRELELREKSQIILANSAKMSALGVMAAGISHEINNPLAIISSYAQQLERLANEKRPLEIVDKVKKIQSAVSRIAQIIKGLKSFSRSGDQDPFETVEVSKIVEGALDYARERFKAHGITIEVDGGAGVFVRCRLVQLEQVILNILNNAFDATVEQDIKIIKIKSEVNGENVKIWVTDSGIGIPPNIRDKIMEPFFTTKEVGKGSGLGLSIAKGIVEEHGGTFDLDNSKAQTTFIITIPLVTKADNRLLKT